VADWNKLKNLLVESIMGDDTMEDAIDVSESELLQVLKDIILADDVIEAPETTLLKNEIFADGVVDQEEIDFLIDLRNSATATCQTFDDFFFDALRRYALADGVIDAAKVLKLRAAILERPPLQEAQKMLLQSLREATPHACPEFHALYGEVITP
jgi:hypothetical protein